MEISAWEQAKYLLDHYDISKMHSFGNNGHFPYKVGGFIVWVSNDDYFPSFQFLHGDESRMVISSIHFFSSPINPTNLFDIRVSFRGVKQTLSKIGFSVVHDSHMTDINDPQMYPKFEFEWSSGLQNPQNKGCLSRLRVDLRGDTFANYYILGDEAKKSGSGDPQLFSQLPEDLIGYESILHKGIPWKIDYDSQTTEFLQTSRLQQFIEEFNNI